ncbi:MAG TPA: TetR family transcriptional regulator [Ktedonobacterales bacterium]|nr:TetR family transcriptional regulator [Ktedonobacterales bacterium]
MRRSKEAKQQTHARIVEAAARRFRADGIAGVAITDLMGEAGLTHGGFYAHFDNKDALVSEACGAGLAQSRGRMLESVRKAPAERRVAAFVARYLTIAHRDHPEAGCMMPTLSAEVARSAPAVRAAYTQAIKDYRDELASLLTAADGSDGSAESGDAVASDEASDQALVLLAGLAGTMLLARAIDDPDLSERMLRVNREFYGRVFTGHSVADALAPS